MRLTRALSAMTLCGCVAAMPVVMSDAPLAVASSDAGASSIVDAAVASGAPDQRPWPTLRPVGRRVLIVGDSEACAVRAQSQGVFDAQADRNGLPHDHVDVDCKGGTTVPYWGAQGHLSVALERHPSPDVVVVFLGTNHYGQNKAPDVSAVLDRIEREHAKCVWVGNTAVNGKRWQINGLIRDAVTPRCVYVDTEAANIPLADNAHPTAMGVTKWLHLVYDAVPIKYEEAHE